ncbi:MAG: tryptophan synthase alpha chain [Candidatus Methanomethylophilaceae archaeon]|nr:tryptophan synthase alpha chain [Candidatus Methanomethylophilaceae archaeon]MDI3541967.1 tryptophan synthase alpha chain [Candidatus Methanomethylophilaceae archaeon]HIJ00291.1 tryptophan synthase subunit alpha [Candidatus Methanomethylophilaceae archaeon]
MSCIKEIFFQLKEECRGAYIPYICVGDPDMDFTLKLVRALAANGADIFEFGIPFSDPIADGRVIQGAMARSLLNRTGVVDVLGLIRSIKEEGIKQPAVVMSYLNPILQYGEERFCCDLAAAGADGILIVDQPPEESAELERYAEENGLDIIRLVAPTTSDERMKMILQKASGYVYAVAVAGVTGLRESVSVEAVELLRKLSELTELPVVLGFGISRPEHVRAAVENGAAGIIEGSNLISIYSSANNPIYAISRHVEEMVSMLPRQTQC